MQYQFKRTVRTTKIVDGKTVIEETVETTEGPEAQAKASEVDKKTESMFKRFDRFFDKMGEAFKEL